MILIFYEVWVKKNDIFNESLVNDQIRGHVLFGIFEKRLGQAFFFFSKGMLLLPGGNGKPKNAF